MDYFVNLRTSGGIERIVKFSSEEIIFLTEKKEIGAAHKKNGKWTLTIVCPRANKHLFSSPPPVLKEKKENTYILPFVDSFESERWKTRSQEQRKSSRSRQGWRSYHPRTVQYQESGERVNSSHER